MHDLRDLTSYLLAVGGPEDDPDPPEDGFVASVAIVLRPAGSSPELLLIRRAESERDPWSGQIALPGGRRDGADASLIETARRETLEETGVHLLEIGQPLGRLRPVVPRSRRLPILSVVPFVFAVPGETSAQVASHEVAEAFWHPLENLRDAGAKIEHRFSVGDEMVTFPAIDVGGRVLWGMTHGILEELLGRLP